MIDTDWIAAYRRLPPEPELLPEPPIEIKTVPLPINLAVLKCPVRGWPVPCGCQVERRLCGDTLDLVTYQDCVQCKEVDVTGRP